jgi:hypothetical protein
MYMSDGELPDRDVYISPVNQGCGNVPFDLRMWQPKHARKARWERLTREEKDLIIAEERREIDQEWAMDSAEAELAKATDTLKRVLEPFVAICCKASDRKGRLSEMDDEEDSMEKASNGTSGKDEDGDEEMDGQETPAGPRMPSLSPELVNNWIQNGNPEISAKLDELAAEQADGGDCMGVDRMVEEEMEVQEEDEKEEEEEDEDDDFWEAGYPGPSSATSQHFSDCPTTLDEDLLAQADENYDEEDINFDWEEHIRELRKENDSPDEATIDAAKARGQYTLPITLPGDRVAVDEEDEREEWFRDYYRNW